ncbi:MAG: helix-turn-helix domain-containing protein [Gemmobacter sp.]
MGIRLACAAQAQPKGALRMITSAQLRAARALIGIDQRQLAARAGLSLPTIQRMEGSGGQVRGVVDSLVKVIAALEAMGVDLIAEGAPSEGGGRGVRLRAAPGGEVVADMLGRAGSEGKA